jgi:hypothetical protein
MNRIMKVCLSVCIVFACCGAGTSAFGYWSQEWTQNFPPEDFGAFTKIEFFIIDAPRGVTFEAPTSISLSPGSSGGWTSIIPNSEYSLLTGPQADSATLTTYFTGPRRDKFEVDFVLWDGDTVVERQEFKWLGGHWQNPNGTLILDSSGGFDPGQYNRTGAPVGTGIPIPSTALLIAPAGLGLLLLRRRISGIPS